MVFEQIRRCWRGRRTALTLAVVSSCLICIHLRSMALWTHARSFAGIPAADMDTFASHAINNTVVVVPVNTGMLHWAENLLCSLAATSFDAKRIVFWALDEGAQKELTRRNRATYRDPTLFATSDNENHHGDTPAYRRMMEERPKFFLNILSAGYDILMLDADTVFWQSPLLLLPQAESDGGSRVDAVFSTDSREFYQTHDAFRDQRRSGSRIPPICGGMFWMKSSSQTVAIWSRMLDVFEMPWPMGAWLRRRFRDDQHGMDVLLNDGRATLVEPFPEGISREMVADHSHDEEASLRVRLLDQTRVVNGHLLKNRHPMYVENLVRLRAQGEDRIAAHFNWDTTERTKEDGARELDMFLLDENGHCRLEGEWHWT